MSSQSTYTIRRNGPVGWERAFEVLRDGKHQAWFHFKEDAEDYVTRKEIGL